MFLQIQFRYTLQCEMTTSNVNTRKLDVLNYKPCFNWRTIDYPMQSYCGIFFIRFLCHCLISTLSFNSTYIWLIMHDMIINKCMAQCLLIQINMYDWKKQRKQRRFHLVHHQLANFIHRATLIRNKDSSGL